MRLARGGRPLLPLPVQLLLQGGVALLLGGAGSAGVHTLQAFSGCELSEDNRTTREFVKYGYNGRDFLSLDMATLTWTAMDEEAKPIKRKWDAEPERGKFWGQFLREACVEGLHTHLCYGTESLLRIDPPVVRVTRRAGSDGRETLFCQLYGFYPKEIEVTWMKDGEDQKPETLTGGVVPNSDGTYHTWLSIEVDPEEKDRYWCHVGHDSLLEPLHLVWEEPASVSNPGLIVGISLGAVAVLVQEDPKKAATKEHLQATQDEGTVSGLGGKFPPPFFLVTAAVLEHQYLASVIAFPGFLRTWKYSVKNSV